MRKWLNWKYYISFFINTDLLLFFPVVTIILLASFLRTSASSKIINYSPPLKNISKLHILRLTEIIHNYTLNKYLYEDKILVSDNTYKDFEIDYDKHSLIFQHTQLQHYIYADVSRQGVSTFGGYFHQPCPMKWEYPVYLNVSHFLHIYDKAVVGFGYHPQFGHVLQDMIGALISVPSEITKDADIFIRGEESQARDYLPLLGFEKNRVHSLPENWIFVKDLYVVVTNYGISGLQVSFRDLHDVIFRVNNLTNLKPTLHVFINKAKKNWGHVTNMHQLYDLSRKNFPQYDWRLLPDTFVLNASETMRTLARTKIFISATGSCSFNMIFLPQNSGLLLIDSRFLNSPCIAIAHTLNIWFYYIASNRINRIPGRTGGRLEVNVFNKSLEMLMTAVYTGKWPEITIPSRKFIQFDKEKTKRLIFKYGNAKKTTVIRYDRRLENTMLTNVYPRLKDYFTEQ